MLRWLFTAASALSLLICCAAAGLWVRSYWVHDTFKRTQWARSIYSYYDLGIQRGRIHAAKKLQHRNVDLGSVAWHYEPDSTFIADLGKGARRFDNLPQPINLAGVHWCMWINEGRVGYVEFPLAYLVLLGALLPLRWIALYRRRWRAQKRRRLGLCGVCGYDLRVHSGCCPECGSKPDVVVKYSHVGGWAVGLALLMPVMALLSLLYWCNPARGVTLELQGHGDPRFQPNWHPITGDEDQVVRPVFSPETSWQPPSGWACDRLRLIDVQWEEYSWERAIWQREGQQFLVIIVLAKSVPGIYVYNRQLALCQEGFVDIYRGVPYCLLEVKCDDPACPAHWRGRWVLALGFVQRSTFQATQPFHLRYRANTPQSPAIAPANTIWFNVIRWIDKQTGAWDTDDWPGSLPYTFRLAEPARAAMQIDR
jgi:hypothetical protein